MNKAADTPNIPENFLKIISPYIFGDNRKVILQPAELLVLWQSALTQRDLHPELQESIAEWTMSAAASSPLVRDNDIFEAVHDLFGSLEVPSPDRNEEKWRELADRVNQVSVDSLNHQEH